MAERTEDQLSRLRVAIATQQLPPDLGVWILEQLQPPAARRAHCVRELRRAAAAMGASRRQAALALAEIIVHFENHPGLLAVGWFPEGSAERIVQLLMRAGADLPSSTRQLLRLLPKG